MGEYAKYNGEEIKIGTCESMYYLRWDQRHLVEAEPGNVNPVKEINSIWFRLPRILESLQSPGDFDFNGYCGARPIPIFIDHNSQLEADVDELLEDETALGMIRGEAGDSGIHYRIPCNHGHILKEPPTGVVYNGFHGHTLGIEAVGVRVQLVSAEKPDDGQEFRWVGFVRVACRVCGKTLFRFSRDELSMCHVLHIGTHEENVMNILDFNALPDYLEQMEIDAEKDMPANLYGWERLRRDKKI